MKRSDLIRMCLQNLFRHRARTLLTVLGVVVGCCSIIIMVSIGVGMRESQEKVLSEMGDLTIITVTSAGNDKRAAKLDDQAVREMKRIARVEVATPKLTADNVQFQFYAGQNRRYVCTWSDVVGLEPEAVEKLGYRLTEGEFPGKKAFTVLVGQDFEYSFSDSKRPEGRNMVDQYANVIVADGAGEAVAAESKKPDSYFTVSKTPVELEMGDEKKVSKKLVFAGRMKADNGKGFETSQGIVMRIQDLAQLLDQASRAAGKKAKSTKSYPTVLVKVRSIQDVEEVENTIKGMGFRTSSMENIRKPMEKEARQKQMMLGGLGAISLLVAALGITNTMIMSITERTREIGVMKSLGCFVRDVRTVFLLEAGCIGLLGGLVGIVASGLNSVVMNLFSNRAAVTSFSAALAVLGEKGSRISVIPVWLVLFALAFSVLIGLGSGYYPANKAVQVSALEAIKHD
ncbi:ABC transporter permease [Anaerotruncus sp. DFI.9.16]|uniref:ABC transporter permease n=1 Tax=Anaerotruncus sp. DFI.9.16 TaxID=2965275 RepID=UPI00210A8334|nr:ABC transporter permease [Anaerotruncus sp. DFI.9.16]MCQ4895367.1 ABC transporter permease [Anaerotruncus sp. DFI.9.16]